ncbi:uncharacterized protein LOC130646995 [Hydractinia symbiolongicarpus]|uniref:uncharacterized protein LOC130646995 n=1 Tax=Hydractinia symbiolongicarpus TaxID=13093 RepID=UPI002551A570|nr:uncharacterized protein LOC130646995 [Hydractinia symbiolongicarpus]
MEKEGFLRCINTIQSDLDVKIRVISTDRHVSIKKLMQTDPRFKHIIHQFDPWHIGKGILKKMIKASKKKDFQLLARWAPAVVNHLYWSIATCKGDGKELAERFVSVVHHTANKHTFPQNSIYKECEHQKLTDEDKRQKEWFQMGSPAHNVLIHIVTQKTLVKDLEQMNEQIHTTMLEVFHSLKIRYLPKSSIFGMEKMIAGTQLAILDHNNCRREQKYQVDDEGTATPLFQIAYSKPTKRFVAKPVKEEKEIGYLFYIIQKKILRASSGKKKLYQIR